MLKTLTCKPSLINHQPLKNSQSHFGITHAPFTHDEQPLLEAQKEILENLRVHSHQRGFCIVAGTPGTGKTVLRKALQAPPQTWFSSLHFQPEK